MYAIKFRYTDLEAKYISKRSLCVCVCMCVCVCVLTGLWTKQYDQIVRSWGSKPQSGMIKY